MNQAVGLGGDDGGADGARARQQGYGKGHDARDFARFELVGFGARLTHLADLGVQHRERHEKQHEAAADLEGGKARAEHAQQRFAEDRRTREHQEHGNRDNGREVPPRPVVARRRHADEDRDGEEGIEYRGQRDEKAKVVLVRAH